MNKKQNQKLLALCVCCCCCCSFFAAAEQENNTRNCSFLLEVKTTIGHRPHHRHHIIQLIQKQKYLFIAECIRPSTQQNMFAVPRCY